MKLVFMGTPEFAVPSLERLVYSEHTVVGVVTVPDKPAGRGQKLRPSAIKRVALDFDLPILQPEKLRDPQFVGELSAWNADLFVIVAFRILPEIVYTLPPKGTFNLHASLLPKYRGAAPINWVLINGEQETGLTTFFLNKTVDTGDILLQRRIPITEEMTAGELHDLLALRGAELVLETVNGIVSNTLIPQQQVGDATLAPKLTKELEQIDWLKGAREIHNLVRGLSPLPGSVTKFRGKLIKILRTAMNGAGTHSVGPGTITRIGKNGPIDVQTGDGIISVLRLKPEGKKSMSAAEFIRGARIEPGEKFGSSE
ncbi:methionyl-tRNA formyltransferase [candidate division KSB1 bacterium]|nr:methionyl-tRNA formyltransferase [candidate division KSB1 bacterium]RQW07010.1 MAG: methionyl-tRNA formyltransferase [candidate division KSB1 bacterium]